MLVSETSETSHCGKITWNWKQKGKMQKNVSISIFSTAVPSIHNVTLTLHMMFSLFLNPYPTTMLCVKFLTEYTILQSQREKSLLLAKTTSAMYFYILMDIFYWCPLIFWNYPVWFLIAWIPEEWWICLGKQIASFTSNKKWLLQLHFYNLLLPIIRLAILLCVAPTDLLSISET